MTPSRFGNSFSGDRQAQYGAQAPSMADTLPSIDFGFNELRERMAQFTMRFDEFIERGRKRVLEERNAFRMNVADLEGKRSPYQAFDHLKSNHSARRQATHPQNRNLGARIEVQRPRPKPRQGSGGNGGNGGSDPQPVRPARGTCRAP